MDEHDLEDLDNGGKVDRSEMVEEADRHLPVANIARIMKKVLPTNAQVSKVINF